MGEFLWMNFISSIYQNKKLLNQLIPVFLLCVEPWKMLHSWNKQHENHQLKKSRLRCDFSKSDERHLNRQQYIIPNMLTFNPDLLRWCDTRVSFIILIAHEEDQASTFLRVLVPSPCSFTTSREIIVARSNWKTISFLKLSSQSALGSHQRWTKKMISYTSIFHICPISLALKKVRSTHQSFERMAV